MPNPQRLMTVFENALELSDSERASYLSQTCAGDDRLRRRVLELLAAHVDAGALLERSPIDDLSPARTLEGTTIGSYRIVKFQGEGGFGHVYLAEQTQPIKRQVALKVVKPGMGSIEVIGRFKTERQALAMMNHPNIAAVFDGGVTPDGSPYFVMEYVDGANIVDYCVANRLPIKDRLKLFMDVCRGIEHAHQKGIIHRDIKPSNVLLAEVDGQLVPKVIDFGVAKAISTDPGEAGFTRATHLVGTPAYMSPEQAKASATDIDTRSDVYSLGVLLYQLLTGTTPHEINDLELAGAEEIRRVIREESPASPSQRIAEQQRVRTPLAVDFGDAPGRLEGHVRGDLDWITMKALHKERAQRYQTATALAADIQRYLSGDVVEARPPSRLYRVKKFYRRNRALCIASVLVAVTVFTASIVAVRSAFVAQRASAAEALRRQQAEAVTEFLVEAFESPSMFRDGKDITVAQILDRTVQQLDDRFGDQPETKAYLLQAISKAYFGLSLPQKALETIEKCQQIEGFNEEVREGEVPLDVRRAQALYRLGNHDQAAKILEEAIPEIRSQLGPGETLLAAELEYSSCLMAQGNYDEAEAMLKRLREEFPLAAWNAAISINLANVYQQTQRPEKAIPIIEEALAVVEQDLGQDYFTAILCRSMLGGYYAQLGRNEKAIELQEGAAQLAEEKLGHEHARTISVRNNLAYTYRQVGQLNRAIDLMRSVGDSYEKTQGATHRQTLISRKNLANMLRRAGRLEEADLLATQILPLFVDVLGNDHLNTNDLRAHISLIKQELGEHESAVAMATEAYDLAQTRFGDTHRSAQRHARVLAKILSLGGDHDEAILLLQAQIAKNPPDSATTTSNQMVLAAAYVRAGRFADASEHSKALLQDDPSLAIEYLRSLNGVVLENIKLGEFSRSVEVCRFLLSLPEDISGLEQHSWLPRGDLGMALLKQLEADQNLGQPITASTVEEAISYLRKAIRDWEALADASPGSETRVDSFREGIAELEKMLEQSARSKDASDD